eukprot:gnl/TRDRNA2_/TRDRNA2_160691_c0_seq1.p1 gnl/TRDRNA2_/TRDRNA2_160691_c0~~gnl/TRDRNA2_/TRDRNA2_160691_c0_seq1.p1  ORF type:complete len:494 (-),score=125.31 gnl/TRDRNA2_/TRDRNA2_160691_c0_seq1:233-1612(-)
MHCALKKNPTKKLATMATTQRRALDASNVLADPVQAQLGKKEISSKPSPTDLLASTNVMSLKEQAEQETPQTPQEHDGSSAELASLRQAQLDLEEMEAEALKDQQERKTLLVELTSYRQALVTSKVRVAQVEAELWKERQACEAVRRALESSTVVVKQLEVETSKKRQASEAVLAELASNQRALRASKERIEHMEAEASRDKRSRQASSGKISVLRQALNALKARVEQVEACALNERPVHEAMPIASTQHEIDASKARVEPVETETSKEQQASEATTSSFATSWHVFDDSHDLSDEDMQAEVASDWESCATSAIELAALRRALDASKARVELVEADASKERQLCEALSTELASSCEALKAAKEQAQQAQADASRERLACQALQQDLALLRQQRRCDVKPAEYSVCTPRVMSHQKYELMVQGALQDSRERLKQAAEQSAAEHSCCTVPISVMIDVMFCRK